MAMQTIPLTGLGRLSAIEDHARLGVHRSRNCHDGRRLQLGGWVTGGTSQAMATAGDNARGELASAICVERFNAAPDKVAKLAELKALTDSYTKRQFIEAGGWATMPGETSPDRMGVQGSATALAA